MSDAAGSGNPPVPRGTKPALAASVQLPPAPRHVRVQSQPSSRISTNPSPSPSPPPAPVQPLKHSRVYMDSPSLSPDLQRPRFASFSHSNDDDEEAQLLLPPRAGVTQSSSLSPLLKKPGDKLSFSEKRKLGKELKAAGLSPNPSPVSHSSKANDANADSDSDSAARQWSLAWLKAHSLQFYESKAFWVFVYSVLLLVTSVGNSIYFKKMINKMENYVYFLNQFTTIIFAPIFFTFVWYQFRFTSDITPEMTQFPKIKFFWMGAFDSVSGVLTLFGAVHTSGSNQALLTNAVIPVTMALSYTILKQTFRRMEYLGSVIIMLGITVVLLPQVFPQVFSHDSASGGEYDNEGAGAQDDTRDLPLFNLLFVLSVVPGALSSIYKELAFVDADIDANYLQAWVSLWQTVFGFFLVPLNTMQFLGPQAVPWDKLWSSFVDGCWCLLGYDVLKPPHCAYHHHPGSTMPTCDDCAGAWLPIALYIAFNLLFNVYTVLLIKYGSATLMFIVMTLRLPMVQLAFSIRYINDPPDHFGVAAGLGLVVILTGLVCYRWPSKTVAVTQPAGMLPTLQRAKTTGGLTIGDYGRDRDFEEERRMILPVIGFNQVFAARHHARHQAVKLARTGSQIRSSLYAQLGVIASPMTSRSPRVDSNGNMLRPSRSSSPLIGANASRSSPSLTTNFSLTQPTLTALASSGSPLLSASSRSRTPPIIGYGAIDDRNS